MSDQALYELLARRQQQAGLPYVIPCEAEVGLSPWICRRHMSRVGSHRFIVVNLQPSQCTGDLHFLLPTLQHMPSTAPTTATGRDKEVPQVRGYYSLALAVQGVFGRGVPAALWPARGYGLPGPQISRVLLGVVVRSETESLSSGEIPPPPRVARYAIVHRVGEVGRCHSGEERWEVIGRA